MEKIVFALWRNPTEDRSGFNARLLSGLPAALIRAGASGIRINLRDAAVDPGVGLVQQWQAPQQDAVAQFWLPSANARFAGPAHAAIAAHCHRFAAWLVTEATIIANAAPGAGAGERTRGWSQASFISFRSDMPREAALTHWLGHHTRIAIETQANFEYVQNLVVRPLTAGAPAYDAFVEECFAAEAMTDPAAFFDAGDDTGDDAGRIKANVDAMMDSCGAFIDFARIDIIPTSQFNFAGQAHFVWQAQGMRG